MPTIEAGISDLEKLVGRKLPREIEGLNEMLQSAKGEVEKIEGDRITISLEDANRPDMWSIEGFAREVRAALGTGGGLPAIRIGKSDFSIRVDAGLRTIRPYMAAVAVRGARLNDEIIKGLMQTQDKIDGTYGRNRRKSSIGLYNLDGLSWPLSYSLTGPNENHFIPLGFSSRMSPAEIMEKHPKGQEHGRLLSGFPKWPIFRDSKGSVLSLPPITNSADLGKITAATRNVLVEVTGTDWATVSNVLRIMTIALMERGGRPFQVSIEYPYQVDGKRKLVTPDFEPRKVRADAADIDRLLGTDLGAGRMAALLGKAQCRATARGGRLEVLAPAWRTDIMHWVDVAEDIAIHLGYKNIAPIPPALPTVGAADDREKYSDRVRELLIGMKMQEVLNFVLTSNGDVLGRMNMPGERLVEIENPVSSEYSVLRHWLLPGLMKFLAANRIHDYPQKVFEVGDCVVSDALAAERSRTVRKVAFAIAHDRANLTQIKSAVEELLRNLGVKWDVAAGEHPSIIGSRCGEIIVKGRKAGLFGEIHPAVLQKWGIEMPVIAAELDLEQLAPQKVAQA